MQSAWDDLRIHERLCKFAQAVTRGGAQGFRSFAVIFDEPRRLGEAEFEAALWQRLQSLRRQGSLAVLRP